MPLKLLFLQRNLTRNPLRALLTCLAVAFPTVIFVLSVGVIDGIERYLENSSRQLRLAVTHKASIVNLLPAGHRRKMESLDPMHRRLVAVCGMRWLGGKIENDPRLLSTLAVDPDAFTATFPEYLQKPDELAAWQRDRQAIVVGRSTAAQFHWKVGDRITIHPSVPPYTAMPFHVVSTAAEAVDALTNFCRRDYLEEIVKQGGWLPDRVGFYFVKCATRSDLDYFRQAIDDLFRNTPDETLTQDEKAFMNQLFTQQFNLPRNLSILAGVTVFVAIMAAMNTMSMSFRDRLNEYAALKAMGFGGGTLAFIVQTESLILCGAGGVVGTVLPYVLFTYSPLAGYTVPVIQKLEIHPLVCGEALIMALAVGLLAALWPTWSVVRLRVVDALRSLE